MLMELLTFNSLKIESIDFNEITGITKKKTWKIKLCFLIERTKIPNDDESLVVLPFNKYSP